MNLKYKIATFTIVIINTSVNAYLQRNKKNIIFI